MGDDDSASEVVVSLIREARKAIKGLTVERAAAAAGISTQTWSRIEQGRAKTIPAGTLAHMAAVTHIQPDELIAVDRDAAARILERIRREPASRADLAEWRAYLRDSSIPIEERRRAAQVALAAYPYLLAGQEPPAGENDGESIEAQDSA